MVAPEPLEASERRFEDVLGSGFLGFLNDRRQR
jgi:hypothetical protein